MSYVDKFLVQDTTNIAKKLGIKIFVETGTYDGRSPKILEPYFDKIYSCEIDARYFDGPTFVGAAGKEYFSNPKFTILNQSSPDALPKFFQEIGHDNFILFLDAHWDTYWPLLDELKVCVSFGFKPVIIIHDFYMYYPDTRFGWDAYHGTVCGLDYVRQSMDEVYGIGGWLHTTCSESEINRGTGFFIPKHKIFNND